MLNICDIWSHCTYLVLEFFFFSLPRSPSHPRSLFLLLPSSFLLLFWCFDERNRPKIECCRSMAWCYRSSGCQSTSIFNVVCGNICTLRHENRWKIVNITSTDSIMLMMSDLLSFGIHRLKMVLFATNRTACANQLWHFCGKSAHFGFNLLATHVECAPNKSKFSRQFKWKFNS